jgi:KDO2-lipid IV(A) lauroyltransferase
VKKPDPAYVIYSVGRRLASLVPDALVFPAAEAMGTLVAKRNQKRREVVRRNMRRVVGEQDLEAMVDEAFKSYSRYWVEALRLPKPGTEEIRRRTTTEGLEHLTRLQDAGRGVVFVSPHIGSYDVAGAFLALHGSRVIAVAEELNPPELFEMFSALRKSVGVDVVPAGKGSTARALLSGLREGATVGLIADRDISGSGVEVEFFGEKTFLPNGPAVLALRTGSPLVVGALYQRPDGRYHAVILEPIDVEAGKSDAARVRELTEQVVGLMEGLIRREPGQWHLFQPNWPSDPGYRWGSADGPVPTPA